MNTIIIITSLALNIIFFIKIRRMKRRNQLHSLLKKVENCILMEEIDILETKFDELVDKYSDIDQGGYDEQHDREL